MSLIEYFRTSVERKNSLDGLFASSALVDSKVVQKEKQVGMDCRSFVHFLLTGRTVLEGMSILVSMRQQVLLHLQLLVDPLVTHVTGGQASLLRLVLPLEVHPQVFKPRGCEAAVLVGARKDLLLVLHVDVSADVLTIG